MISLSTIDFNSVHILIVGDIILDKYFYGAVSRISPEAPVPIVHVKSQSETLGGAANVASNIRGFTATATIIGAVSVEDDAGKSIKHLMDTANIDYRFIDAGVPTISKLRIIGSKQQIARLDFEEVFSLDEVLLKQLKVTFDEELANADVVVISDYGKGICSEELCKYVIERTNYLKKPIVIDPKGSNWDKYSNAFIITPNVKELSEVAGYNIENTDEEVVKAGSIIRDRYNLEYLIVTRSEKGMTLISEDSSFTIPTVALEVFDVSGAGDTVVASIAVFLAAGLEMSEVIRLANIAAGVVVGKLGTSPILLSELLYHQDDIKSSKIVRYEDVPALAAYLHERNKKIVFTNGCFDILHRGHITYLKAARNEGDLLIVGLNSDASVKRLKGNNRPINNEDDRAFILSNIEAIDFVIIFEEDTPYNLIKLIEPDLLIKGGDYKVDEVIGREFAKETKIIDFVDGYSTTSLIKKIEEK